MVASVLAFTSPLLALGVLACPLGMGAMMWFMMRGGRSQPALSPAQRPASVDELRREHERLGAQIEHLEDARHDSVEDAHHDSWQSAGELAAASPEPVAGAADTLMR